MKETLKIRERTNPYNINGNAKYTVGLAGKICRNPELAISLRPLESMTREIVLVGLFDCKCTLEPAEFDQILMKVANGSDQNLAALFLNTHNDIKHLLTPEYNEEIKLRLGKLIKSERTPDGFTPTIIAAMIFFYPELAAELKPFDKLWHADLLSSFTDLGNDYSWPCLSLSAKEPNALSGFNAQLRKVASHGQCLGYLLKNHAELMRTILTPKFRKTLEANPETSAVLL